MNNNFVKHTIALIVLFLCVFIAYDEWYVGTGIITHGDWYTVEEDWLHEAVSMPSIWSSAADLGGPVLLLSFYPIQWAMGVLSMMGFGFGVIERVLFLWPITILPIIGMYVLSYRILRSIPAACVASLVYFFNTYFMLGRTGHLTLMTANAFVPLIFYLYLKLGEKQSYYISAMLGILLSLVSFYEIRVLYMLVPLVGLLTLFTYRGGKWLSISFVSHAMKMGFPILCAIIVNLFWIVALSKVSAIGGGEFFQRILFGNHFMSLERAVTLFHPFWSGGKLATFKVQELPFYFWFVPILAFFGLYAGRSKKIVLYFGIVGIIGIILAKQVDVPFPELYEWLYLHFPGFIAFREASKFYGLIALSYAILIGSTVQWLWKSSHKILAGVTTLAISALFLFNAMPLLNGDFYELQTVRYRPVEYEAFNKQLSALPNFSRTLWVPFWSRWSYYTEIHPRANILNLIGGPWQDIWKENGNNKQISIEQIFSQEYLDRLLDLSSIQYVVVPIRDTDNDDDFFVNYGKRERFVQDIRSLDYLTEISPRNARLSVFENSNFRPHVYATYEKDTLKHDAQQIPIEVDRQSPTKYIIAFEKAPTPVHVYLTDAYSPDWEVTIHQSRGGKYTSKKTDAQLNEFTLDPQDGFVKHPDGTISFTATLAYRPQFYLQQTIVLSIALGVLCAVLVKYLMNKRRNDK